MMHLFENLMHRLLEDVLEFFLVQSWLIWHQRNRVMHGGILQEPGMVNARVGSFLEEYKEAQSQLTIPVSIGLLHVWQPLEGLMYKLNFDVAIFTDISASSVGVIIRNVSGHVMAALSSKGLAFTNSEKAEVLACRQAMEFVWRLGFQI